MVLPFYSGISEQLQRVFRSYGVQMCFRPCSTLKRRLVKPKDSLNPFNRCGVIYNIKCQDYEAQYIGETAKRLATRLKEHRKSVSEADFKSALSDHTQSTRQSIDWDNTRIIDSEPNDLRRKIREGIYIRRQHPSMNRDQGFQLASVYGAVLQPHACEL